MKKWTNRRIRNLAKAFARRFRLKWLPDGDPNLMDGFPPGTVIDPMRGCEVAVLYVTKGGKGVGLMAADAYHGAFVRVSPNALGRALSKGKSSYYRGKWTDC